MYVLSYQDILGYGQLLVLDESLSVLLNMSWYCCNCTVHFWANKMMMTTTTKLQPELVLSYRRFIQYKYIIISLFIGLYRMET